ncbi:MAG: hypothetical protein ACE5JG_08175 [Planctomycetota bacterium]
MVLSRVLHVLRRGPLKRRLQAGIGLLALAAAALWAMWFFLRYAVLLCLVVAGFVLLARSLRGSRRSS